MHKNEITLITQAIIGNILHTEIDLSKNDANLFDLGLDSMSIIDLLVAIEEEFELELDESELKEDIFTSAHKIVDLIDANLPKES